MFGLICLAFVLVGVVGLQFAYLFYIEHIYRERRKYLHDLEKRHADLKYRLEAAEKRVAMQDELLAAADPEMLKEDWAEVIEER